jgi:hypothetical protein
MSTERFIVWITTSNLKLCYLCSFYVAISILYYCNILCILYESVRRGCHHLGDPRSLGHPRLL